jgi:hypothetical protein
LKSTPSHMGRADNWNVCLVILGFHSRLSPWRACVRGSGVADLLELLLPSALFPLNFHPAPLLKPVLVVAICGK